MPMEIIRGKPAARGVSELMYVGDDGMPIGEKSLLAWLAGAVVGFVVAPKGSSKLLYAIGGAAVIGAVADVTLERGAR